MDRKDEILYCGTSTGDILKIRLNYHHDKEILDPIQRPIMIGCYARLDEKNIKAKPHERVKLYSMGVRSILILEKNVLLIGAGNGTINLVKEQPFLDTGHIKLPSTPNLIVVSTVNTRITYTMCFEFPVR